MKRITLLTIALCSLLSATATVLVTEKFKNSGSAIAPGSNGWLIPSTQTGGTPPEIINVANETISDTLKLAFVTSATTSGKTYGKLVGSTFGNKTLLYLACKVKITEFGSITNNQAIWAIGLGKSDFSKAPIKIGFEYTTPNGVPCFNVGLSKGGDTNNNRSRTTTNYPLNTQLLLIAKYELGTINVTTDDKVTLYINPTLSDTEPSTPNLTAPAGSFADFVELDELVLLYRQAGLGAKITDIVLTDSWADLAVSIPTAFNPLFDDSYKVSVNGYNISVENNMNSKIEIFDAMGKMITTRINANSTTDFTLKSKGLYIVKIGNKAVKVIL